MQTRSASDLQVLLLSRGCDIDEILKSGTLAPDASRTAMEALAQEWIALKANKGSEASPQLRKLARLFETRLAKELRDAIACVPGDAMDKERKIFKIKVSSILAHKRARDVADPKISCSQVTKRNQDRIRMVMKEAEDQRLLPPATVEMGFRFPHQFIDS